MTKVSRVARVARVPRVPRVSTRCRHGDERDECVEGAASAKGTDTEKVHRFERYTFRSAIPYVEYSIEEADFTQEATVRSRRGLVFVLSTPFPSLHPIAGFRMGSS